MKAYTDINQSKILAEILPLESADMCLTFVNNVWNPVFGKANDIYQIQKNCYEPDYTKDDYVDIDEFEPKVVPCWSLAALIELITKIQQGGIFYNLTYDFILNKWTMNIEADNWRGDVGLYDNPVDACVEMIKKLHELKLL